jgi:hypothetical protein
MTNRAVLAADPEHCGLRLWAQQELGIDLVVQASLYGCGQVACEPPTSHGGVFTGASSGFVSEAGQDYPWRRARPASIRARR